MKDDDPISTLCDNTSSINISKNHVMHSKTKYIHTKFMFLQEKSHKDEHQVGVHLDKRKYSRYIHQSTPKGYFWVSLIETKSNFYSKLTSIIFSRKIVVSSISRALGERYYQRESHLPFMSKGEWNKRRMLIGGAWWQRGL